MLTNILKGGSIVSKKKQLSDNRKKDKGVKGEVVGGRGGTFCKYYK